MASLEDTFQAVRKYILQGTNEEQTSSMSLLLPSLPSVPSEVQWKTPTCLVGAGGGKSSSMMEGSGMHRKELNDCMQTTTSEKSRVVDIAKCVDSGNERRGIEAIRSEKQDGRISNDTTVHNMCDKQDKHVIDKDNDCRNHNVSVFTDVILTGTARSEKDIYYASDSHLTTNSANDHVPSIRYPERTNPSHPYQTNLQWPKGDINKSTHPILSPPLTSSTSSSIRPHLLQASDSASVVPKPITIELGVYVCVRENGATIRDAFDIDSSNIVYK